MISVKKNGNICCFKNTNLGLEAKDGNSKTDQDSNTQADDDRFSIVVAREIEPEGKKSIESYYSSIKNRPIKDMMHAKKIHIH